MIHPDLPEDLKVYQAGLLVEYDLHARTQKPDKPIEVGYRVRLKGQEDPQEEWWKLKDKTDKGALEAIEGEVIPAIRALLPEIEKVKPPEPAPAKEWV